MNPSIAERLLGRLALPLLLTLGVLSAACGGRTCQSGQDCEVIVLLHDGSSAHSKGIDTIREEYKTRFNQESVLRVDSTSCVNFD